MKIQISALINKSFIIILVLLASFLMPFNVYANSEIQIVPTWSQSSQQSQWANKFRVTNFCESSNNPQNYSCQLTITVNGDYYGYVYFDGYINNQKIFDYKTIFISGGKGTFYYTWYQNGLKEINKVNIAGLSLFSPTDDIDLSQIIDLLTSINSYNQQEVGNQGTQIQQLQTIINDFIVSNGYLETLTKIRQFHVPFESYGAIFNLLSYKEVYEYQNLYSYNYPIFQLQNGNRIFRGHSSPTRGSSFIISFDQNIWDLNELYKYISITPSAGEISTINFNRLYYNGGWSTVKVNLQLSVNAFYDVYCILDNILVMPLFVGYWDTKTSTDFALLYGFSNQLLDDLHIIANGTSASNQQSSNLSSGTDSMQQQMNNLVGVEDSYNQQFNNSVNSIDFTNPLQQNQGLLGASNFVITVFNGLIANNPFSILIIIVCILLIGKKVIGK